MNSARLSISVCLLFISGTFYNFQFTSLSPPWLVHSYEFYHLPCYCKCIIFKSDFILTDDSVSKWVSLAYHRGMLSLLDMYTRLLHRI